MTDDDQQSILRSLRGLLAPMLKTGCTVNIEQRKDMCGLEYEVLIFSTDSSTLYVYTDSIDNSSLAFSLNNDERGSDYIRAIK